MGMPTNIIPNEEVALEIIKYWPKTEEAVAAFAILRHESGGFNEYAVNLVLKDDPEDLSHKTLDKGMAQFNTRWWPEVSENQAFTWQFSVEMMYLIYLDRGFQDWTAFTNLAYLRHVPLAYEVFESIGVQLPK